jgi:hypothetical protein
LVATNVRFERECLTRRLIASTTLLLFFFLVPTAFTQGIKGSRGRNPYECLDAGRHESLAVIRDSIRKKLSGTDPQDAFSYCSIAELMKRAGDYRAENYYEKAINADDAEPAYELFYAEYLRNFRGAQHPLFPQAEHHYFVALRKLIHARQREAWDDATQKRVERGMVALYQEDGLPLLHRKSAGINTDNAVEVPVVFFSTINRNAELTTDFDNVDDVRAFSAEALFASSPSRLNRSLSVDELKNILRPKVQFETVNRLRLRYKQWPAVDLFYKYREIENAQITNFFEPNKFNDFRLSSYGLAVEKPFKVSPYFDLFLRESYQRIIRKGLIEFFPESNEQINQFETKGAISHFFGPDKAVLESTHVFQDINPIIPNPFKRNRQIISATFTYQIFRPLPFLQKVYGQRFETRGLHLFSGIVRDKERFGNVDVKREDLFVGASLKGLGKFDVTLQPTFFKSYVTGDKSQNNSQFRTNFNLLYRILDEEDSPDTRKKIMGIYPAFVHLVIPFKHDVAMSGLPQFANVNAGIELDIKSYTTGLRRTTFLTSFRYNYQRFYKLDRNLNLYSVNLKSGHI